MQEPDWAALGYPTIDYQNIVYYAAPRQQAKKASLDEVDPKLLETFDRLGIPLSEQKRLSNVAVDAVFDSVSIATTFKEKLAEHGVIFCPISEAVQEHPDLVQRYLGSVVPSNDNFFAALNSAVFSDGSFVFIPKGVECRSAAAALAGRRPASPPDWGPSVRPGQRNTVRAGEKLGPGIHATTDTRPRFPRPNLITPLSHRCCGGAPARSWQGAPSARHP